MLKTFSSKISAVAIAATTFLISTAPLVVAETDSSSVHGKYSDLIQMINCPTALDEYGEFNDWGYWKGGEVCGKDGTSGYWVYDYPNWFVWRDINGTLPTDHLPAIASNYGKYDGLLQVVTCESDWENQGDFKDYGYWEGGKVCEDMGQAGYWVYVYPHWYVWDYEAD